MHSRVGKGQTSQLRDITGTPSAAHPHSSWGSSLGTACFSFARPGWKCRSSSIPVWPEA